MNNVLDLLDQTVFDGERATGVTNLLQVVWVYEHAIDIDGLRRFHANLAQGRLSRRIERSPLPFGWHRWVSPGGGSALEITALPRPREAFDAWLDEQANTPLDPEHGPGWPPTNGRRHPWPRSTSTPPHGTAARPHWAAPATPCWPDGRRSWRAGRGGPTRTAR